MPWPWPRPRLVAIRQPALPDPTAPPCLYLPSPTSPPLQVGPAFADLLCSMWSVKYASVVSPSAFLKRISKHDSRWGDSSQQDSQEFLHSLLEALQTESNRVTAKPAYRELEGKGSVRQQAAEAEHYSLQWNDSIVGDIFGGQLQSTIQCQVGAWPEPWTLKNPDGGPPACRSTPLPLPLPSPPLGYCM